MTSLLELNTTEFNIVEASIEDHRYALETGQISSSELVISCLNRIATYDICGALNAFTVFNGNVLKEAGASDLRRAQGLKPRPLEGIPYTIKDSYSVEGMTVTNGSPALIDLMSKRDSFIAAKLKEAGAILIGKTNMPPMAAGGMQRGLYGRAESPYNCNYLTGAFSSGSSNGAATSIASSMAVFGMGSETVSSGRSPASNNALVCYTPSKGVLSCRGLWPLYVTCDVPTPFTRSVSDMLHLLDVIGTEDSETTGDFIREQTHITIPKHSKVDYQSLKTPDALRGKNIGVPKLYAGQKDSDSSAKPVYVSPEIIALWQTAEKDLISLGANVVYTDFPLVTRYEDDGVSGEANNVTNCPDNWNKVERTTLIAQVWDSFLKLNDDPKLKSLKDIKDSRALFPKPPNYLPDTFLELRNWIDYAGLPSLLDTIDHATVHETPGLAQALHALESQRKRDLEDWMTANNLDLIAFTAQGYVGIADLVFILEITKHSLRNGVKYSNGNRAIRHLGVPTVSVPVGMMQGKNMPVNITFAGRAYEDAKLLEYAYAFEKGTKRREAPGELKGLESDIIPLKKSVPNSQQRVNLKANVSVEPGNTKPYKFFIAGTVSPFSEGTTLEIWIDGKNSVNFAPQGENWDVEVEYTPVRPECLGWDLKPLPERKAMVIIVAKVEGGVCGAEWVWVDYSGKCR